MQWEISDSSISQVLAIVLPLGGSDLNGFAAQGIYAADTLVNSSTTEYLSTLTLTTDGRNETEVYCRARLGLGLVTALGQPATVIVFGECAV